eukprot:g44617.t1
MSVINSICTSTDPDSSVEIPPLRPIPKETRAGQARTLTSRCPTLGEGPVPTRTDSLTCRSSRLAALTPWTIRMQETYKETGKPCWPKAVYIPPHADVKNALDVIYTNTRETKFPEALFIVAGNFNQANLKQGKTVSGTLGLRGPDRVHVFSRKPRSTEEAISLALYLSLEHLVNKDTYIRLLLIDYSFHLQHHYPLQTDLKTVSPRSQLHPLQLDPQLSDPQTAISED